MAVLTSAAGLVGFLAEHDPALRSFALHRLNDDVDLLWPEISNSISQMFVFSLKASVIETSVDKRLMRCREALTEDEAFPERELAALVASKVYYQLGEYNESMIFALIAGKLFNLDSPGEYEDTIIGECYSTIDTHTNKY
jgi:26S proteasome regulatory subunit N2